mmetsp:Transcript_35241/g.88117  ORF Transcript_35241/g.88117 Transcript_35241/m.88117 type:complete len:87 (+) Transcript_35241:624-884(+)
MSFRCQNIVQNSDVLVFRSQSANRIDELYYKGMRLRRDAAARAGTKSGAAGYKVRGGRLSDEVTGQTQAIQSIAGKTVMSFQMLSK